MTAPEFVHPPPNFQIKCSICLLVLRTPHIVTWCGHNFCKGCIERVQKAGKCCPLCNEENIVQAYNRQFEVYCTHRQDGCEWTGKLEMLDEHLNINPKIDKMMEGCAYVEVQCFNDGCEQNFQHHVILDHQSRECPLRDFSCEHCHEYESTYLDVMTNHWPVCKCYPLPCPHECRQDTIQRQYLEHHLNEECPLQEVDCEFKYAGCETRLPHKDMREHLKDGIIHVSLLARQNQLLSQQNQELMTKLLEEEQLRRTREEGQRKLEEKFTKYQQDSEQRLAEKDEQIKQLTADMREMKRALQSTGNSLKKLSDSAARTSSVQKLKNQVADLTQKQEASDSKLRSRLAQTSDVETMKAHFDSILEQLHLHAAMAPIQIIMSNFKHHKEARDSWYSDGFYTHPRGYKVCLRVDANGDGASKGSHVSCFICVVRGEFDSHLKWPFRGVFTITLLNQREDANHHTHTLAFNDQTPDEVAARVITEMKSALGWGIEFLPHYNPVTNCQYLDNDCLRFQVKFRIT